MNCSEFASRIDGYLDGRLHPEDEKALRNHLAECPVCAEEAEVAQDLRQPAARLPPPLDPLRRRWQETENRLTAVTVFHSLLVRRSLTSRAAAPLVAGSVLTG